MNKLNPQIFREYDIRGTVGRDLSNDFAFLLGRAYATLAKDHGKNNIAIGYDCRHSSEGYARALADGMSSEGVDSVLTGMGPTPQLYYSIFKRNYGGGIQVTGSHNPPDMNGFKLCLGTDTLASSEIQDLRKRCEVALTKPAGAMRGKIGEDNIRSVYLDELVHNCKGFIGKRKIKVVVDAGNGVGGLVGPEMLRRLGCEVIELYCEPDGNFPNHHPDPTVIEYIQDLIKAVKQHKADLGIGWDGDADRIGVVDQNGEIIFGDMLLLIYARQILKDVPGATIIGDVKCSSRLFDDIKKRSGNPIMWKTGHSLIKQKLKETKGALGGEMSGHIAFKHRFYGFDDAIYSTARLMEVVSQTDLQVSEFLKDLPQMVSTPEIRADCPEEIKFKIAELAKEAFKEFEVNTIDGVRIQFERGWALVRASNTQPILVMRFEAQSQSDLAQYQKLVTERIEAIKRSL